MQKSMVWTCNVRILRIFVRMVAAHCLLARVAPPAVVHRPCRHLLACSAQARREPPRRRRRLLACLVPQCRRVAPPIGGLATSSPARLRGPEAISYAIKLPQNTYTLKLYRVIGGSYIGHRHQIIEDIDIHHLYTIQCHRRKIYMS